MPRATSSESFRSSCRSRAHQRPACPILNICIVIKLEPHRQSLLPRTLSKTPRACDIAHHDIGDKTHSSNCSRPARPAPRRAGWFIQGAHARVRLGAGLVGGPRQQGRKDRPCSPALIRRSDDMDERSSIVSARPSRRRGPRSQRSCRLARPAVLSGRAHPLPARLRVARLGPRGPRMLLARLTGPRRMSDPGAQPGDASRTGGQFSLAVKPVTPGRWRNGLTRAAPQRVSRGRATPGRPVG